MPFGHGFAGEHEIALEQETFPFDRPGRRPGAGWSLSNVESQPSSPILFRTGYHVVRMMPRLGSTCRCLSAASAFARSNRRRRTVGVVDLDNRRGPVRRVSRLCIGSASKASWVAFSEPAERRRAHRVGSSSKKNDTGTSRTRAQLVQPAGADAIGAALVFLHLLKGQADRLAELFLAQAQHVAPQPHARADMDIDRVGSVRFATSGSSRHPA